MTHLYTHFFVCLMFSLPANSLPAFKINRIFTLEYLPSGSGLAIISGSVFIIGDDSPFLFELDKDLELHKKHLIKEEYAYEEKIPKLHKPDFESIAEEPSADGPVLYLFGSGSKSPERDELIVFQPNFTGKAKKYSLTPFYDILATFNGGERESLNLEGAFISGKNLFLLNRAGNQLLIVALIEFKEFLEGSRTSGEMDIAHYAFRLPVKANVQAGFSGACTIPGTTKVVFTASLEDTGNWIDDGEILGSYLGILDTTKLADGQPLFIEPLKNQKGTPLQDKLEGVAFNGFDEEGNVKLLIVADNDDGKTRVFACSLRKDSI